MRSMSAHDAKDRFGQLLEAARSGPVTIEKHGREVAVLISKEEFDALQAVKDGRLDATVFQDAAGQGAGSIATALKIIKKQPFEKQVFIPFQLVTKENVGQFVK